MRQTRLMPPFHAAGGHCWTIALDPELYPETDNPSDPSGSVVRLMEDGVDLGPPHTAHQLIMRDGGGAYSHWSGMLHFSTSDHSDPNQNGRRYDVCRDPQKYFENRARHAVGIVESYLRRLPGGRATLDGATVLEIGPGRDMGTVLLLAGLGASSVTAVDRFAGSWDDDWHGPFTDALTAEAASSLSIDISGITAAARSSRSFNAGNMLLHTEPFEVLAGMGHEFDVTVSHSVFEHFYSMQDAARALFAVSAAGSYGAHHVDFRDHRNFGEPLEFLLVPDDIYAMPVNNDEFGRGNRTRADEMAQMLADAGFTSIEFMTESTASGDYLAHLEARLRVSRSRFRDHPLSALRILSGEFGLRRSR